MITQVKYWIFAWHFKGVVGHWPNANQRKMFYDCERGEGLKILNYSRQSGATTFIIVYANLLDECGYDVAIVGSRYLRKRADELLGEQSFLPIYENLTQVLYFLNDRPDTLLIDEEPTFSQPKNISDFANTVAIFRTK